MENIGALSILLAFCFAVYAVVASVIGKFKKNSFLIVSGQRAVLFGLAAADRSRPGCSSIRFETGDFRLAYVAAHTDSSMSARLQVHGMVGRAGRLAAVVVLAAGDLFGHRGLHQPAQVPRHDAVGNVGLDGDRDLLPDPDRVRAEPLRNPRSRPRQHRRRRRRRAESAAAVLDHGDPSAHAVLGLRRIHRAVRLCDGVADHQAARRCLDSHYARAGPS